MSNEVRRQVVQVFLNEVKFFYQFDVGRNQLPKTLRLQVDQRT